MLVSFVSICLIGLLAFLFFRSSSSSSSSSSSLSSSSSYVQNAQQWLRKVLAVCYLWHWQRQTGQMFPFVSHSMDMEKSGLKSMPQAIERENPRTLKSDLNAVDGVSFLSSGSDGSALIVRIVRHHDRCSQAVVSLRLASGEEYQLPRHPDCLVHDTDGRSFTADGLVFEVMEPLRRWRISFNGALAPATSSDHHESDQELTTVPVQFSFIWKPICNYIAFPHDLKSQIVADQLAKQHSNFFDLLDSVTRMLKSGERHEQFGEMQGQLKIGDRQPQTLLFRGIKTRMYGIHDLTETSSEISIKGITKHGACIHLFAVNMKDGRSFIYGYVAAPCNTVIRHVHQWSADITRLAMDSKFSISFNAGDRHYELEMSTNHSGLRLWSGRNGAFRQDIRVFRLKLNGKEGYGFVERGHHSEAHGSQYANRKSLPQLIEPDIVTTDRLVVTFKDVQCRSSNIVGGKGASLALMTSMSLSGWPIPVQFEVPQGVCITKVAFERHLRDNPEVEQALKTLEDIAWKRMSGSIDQQSEKLVTLVKRTAVSPAFKAQLKSALCETFDEHFEQHKFAVRSSAIGEDGEDVSAAGQNETFLGIRGLEEISVAIVNCWASQFSHRSVEYKRQNGQLINSGMAVVVQQMVPADVAGVLFTNHPVTGSRAYMLISSNYGLGESVVSGSADPDTILLKRNWDDRLSVLDKQVGEKKHKIMMSEDNGVVESTVSCEQAATCTLTDDLAIRLGRIAIHLERSWGNARDVEFAIKGDNIYLLQSRPVTTDSLLSEFDILHEFDSGLRTDEETFSCGNIGEVFPGALTPLLFSTFARILSMQIESNSTWKEIRHRFDPTVNEYFPIAYRHAFFNRMMEKFFSLDKEKSEISKSVEMGIYGSIQDDEDLLRQAIERADNPPKTAQIKVIKLLFKGLFLNKWIMQRVIEKFDNYPALARNATTATEAYADITDKCMQAEEVLHAHYQISCAATICNVLVLNCLSNGKAYTMDQYSDFAKLTSGAIGTESGDVPHSLNELAATIADDIEPAQFCDMSTSDALKWITKNRLASNEKYKEFLHRHGHRGYKEFDVGYKTWKMEPERLIKIMQDMLRNPAQAHSGGASKEAEVDITDTLQTPLTPIRKFILRWIIRGVRHLVQKREKAKSLLIKTIDGSRQGYWHLARLMVHDGLLPDEELIFFLTHEEIGQVIDNRSAKLIRRAKQRQRMHKTAEDYKFPLIFSGIPKPINMNQDDVDLDSRAQVTGFPVSQGTIQGPARVIHSFDQVGEIRQGDILITYSTDIGWSPYFPMLVGIVTEIGGLVSHGAVVAREFGLPCIVGATNATQIFKSGETVLLNANKGVLSRVAI